MAQQVQSQREEQQFALNATARETISKVKGMLTQQAGAPAPPLHRGGAGFEPPSQIKSVPLRPIRPRQTPARRASDARTSSDAPPPS